MGKEDRLGQVERWGYSTVCAVLSYNSIRHKKGGLPGLLGQLLPFLLTGRALSE